MAAERFVELGLTRCLEVVVRGAASQPKLHGDVVANPTASSKPPVIAGLGQHGNPFPNRIEMRVQRRAARRRTLDRSQEFFDPAHGAERDRGVIPVRRVQGRFGRCEKGDDGLAGAGCVRHSLQLDGIWRGMPTRGHYWPHGVICPMIRAGRIRARVVSSSLNARLAAMARQITFIASHVTSRASHPRVA